MLKYIAAPYYKHADKDVLMVTISSYSATCLKRGDSVICPLTMGHNFIKLVDLPRDSEWWLKWCYDLLSKCDEMDVLCLDGWEDSTGVQAEIKFAKENNIKINYIYEPIIIS